MQDEYRRREARMMNAVAGLGGRSVLSAEVDIRLGVAAPSGDFPSWTRTLARVFHLFGRASPGPLPAQVRGGRQAAWAATPGSQEVPSGTGTMEIPISPPRVVG